jgi:hypothetical protein
MLSLRITAKFPAPFSISISPMNRKAGERLYALDRIKIKAEHPQRVNARLMAEPETPAGIHK